MCPWQSAFRESVNWSEPPPRPPPVHSRPLQSYEIHDDLHDAHPPLEEMLANLTLRLRAGEVAPDASAVDGAKGKLAAAIRAMSSDQLSLLEEAQLPGHCSNRVPRHNLLHLPKSDHTVRARPPRHAVRLRA